MHPRTLLAPSGRGVRWQPGSVARITALVTPPQNDRFGTVFAITLPERRTAPIGGDVRGSLPGCRAHFVIGPRA